MSIADVKIVAAGYSGIRSLLSAQPLSICSLTFAETSVITWSYCGHYPSPLGFFPQSCLLLCCVPFASWILYETVIRLVLRHRWIPWDLLMLPQMPCFSYSLFMVSYSVILRNDSKEGTHIFIMHHSLLPHSLPAASRSLTFTACCVTWLERRWKEKQRGKESRALWGRTGASPKVPRPYLEHTQHGYHCWPSLQRPLTRDYVQIM